MPAAVIPSVQLHIGMQIEHDGRYMVGCPECDWFPDPFFDEAVAKQDAYQHNVTRHEGAGVELRTDAPVQMAALEVRLLRKRERASMVLGFIYAAVFPLLAMLTISGWFGISVLAWGLCAVVYGQTWGKWNVRRVQAEERLEQMRQAFNTPPPEGTQL